MDTHCTQLSFGFHRIGRRDVVARFDGGPISSDAGGLLLRQAEQRTGILRQFAGCFRDHRDPGLIEHSLEHLIAQRVYGLCLGYEDLNDHDTLRHDPLLAVMVGHDDPLGTRRRRAGDRGRALAGKSTLNRLELTRVGADPQSRYQKIVADCGAIDRLLVDLFLQAHHGRAPDRIVLDFDATDDPIHGDQLGKFFHGYYRCDCYLPLYVFCGDHLLCAKLRPSRIDAAAGSAQVLEQIVSRVRAAWPKVRIVVRADSGFCRGPLMDWCDRNGVDYVLGLAKNKRLLRALGQPLHEAKQRFEQTGQAARVYQGFTYQTRKSWRRPRRVIGKAEHLSKGANPRFVVTSLPPPQIDARALYEDLYCARGEMENRIKEQQLYLFADRTSSHTMRANQIRLYLSAIAYTLMNALRRLGLKGTAMAQAQCSTIRVKLLKIGARIRITARKVWVSLSQACPYQDLFARAYRQLTRAGPDLA